jgi:hypothetical protein
MTAPADALRPAQPGGSCRLIARAGPRAGRLLVQEFKTMRTPQTSSRTRAHSVDPQKALAGWFIMSAGLLVALMARWREFARP